MRHINFFVFLCFLTYFVSCKQQKKYIKHKGKKGETAKPIVDKPKGKVKDFEDLNKPIEKKPKVKITTHRPIKKVPKKNLKPKAKVVVADKPKKEKGKKSGENKKLIEIEKLKKNFVVHEIVKGDNFYRLTRLYNVFKKTLIELNPYLTKGLKVGQFIKIRPVIKKVEKIEEKVYQDELQNDITIKATILLPFKAKNIDSLTAREIFTKSKLANIVTEFYLGAESAIDSLRNQGVKIDLKVIDTEKNSTKIDLILSEHNLNDNDVIIGPLYSEEAKVVANNIRKPVVFPIYSKNQHTFPARIIKTAPEKNIFRSKLISYINSNYTDGKIILVGDGNPRSNNSNEIIKKTLEKNELIIKKTLEKKDSIVEKPYEEFNELDIEESLEVVDTIPVINELTPEEGFIAKKRFLNILKPNTNNWVILTSDSRVLVADAINSLISLPDSTSVRVFTYNKGKAFDKIDNLKLAKVNLTYVSDEFVDNTSSASYSFNRQYYNKNNTLPSYHAMRGFDVVYDILIRLASGNSLKSTFKKGTSYRVKSKFEYTKNRYKGLENKGLFIIQYNEDLSLTRLE